MKYFFLSEGWTYSRVWEMGGIWDELDWGRSPEIHRLNLGIVEQQEILWLYQVEDDVIMVEVKPTQGQGTEASSIGNVLLKRLITAEEVIDRLSNATAIVNTAMPSSPSEIGAPEMT